MSKPLKIESLVPSFVNGVQSATTEDEQIFVYKPESTLSECKGAILPNRTMVKLFYEWYAFLGYQKDLPEVDRANKAPIYRVVNTYLDTVFLENRIVPRNVPIMHLFNEWKRAIINSEAQRPYANLASHGQSVNKWLSSVGQKPFAKYAPKPKPTNLLTSSSSVSKDEAIKALKALYGDNYKQSKAYKRIINQGNEN